MTISVVIPTINEAGTISACLKSLLAQTRKPKEIIVVDDSLDPIQKIIDKWIRPCQTHGVRLHYVRGDNTGVASARDKGFHMSQGDIIASIDADCRADANWLEQLCSPLESTLCQATTGKIIMEDAPKIITWITRLGWYGLYYRLVDRFLGFHLFSGANGALLKKTYAHSGGFNCLKQDINDLDDAELAARLSRITKIVFISQAVVYTSFRRFVNTKRAISTTITRARSLRRLSKTYINK